MNRKKLSNNEMIKMICFIKHLLLMIYVGFWVLTKLFFQNRRPERREN